MAVAELSKTAAS